MNTGSQPPYQMQPEQVPQQPMPHGQVQQQPMQPDPQLHDSSIQPGTNQQNEHFNAPNTNENASPNNRGNGKGQVMRYPCPYCPFLTAISAEMQAHLRTHSQPQPQYQPPPHPVNKDVNFNQTGNQKMESQIVDQQGNPPSQEFNEGSMNLPPSEADPKQEFLQNALSDKIGADGLIEGAEKINGEFICTYCNKTFKYPAKVNVHVKAVHLKIQDLACTKCEFKTAYNFKLQNHLKNQNHF